MIDGTNRNTALASALVEELARCGARRAVLSPGSRSSPLALALEREPEIELSVVLDERSAGFLAVGAALAGERPAIVACTSGTAAANLHPAVLEADEAGVPLVVLTSDRPPELRGIGAGQTIDQIKLYGSAVRWFCEVGSHEADDDGLIHYRSVACRAWAEAAGGGPVHLNLPWREPLGPETIAGEVTAVDPLALEGRSEARPLTAAIRSREPHEELIEALAGALARSRRALIVAGREPRTDVAAAVAALSARAELPILAEPTSQLRFGSHRREGLIAAYDGIVRELPERLEPDLVLRFGDMPTSKPLRRWLAAGGAPDQIVIDPPGRWNEPTRRAGALVSAEAASVARALTERAQPGEGGWLSAWAEAEAAAQAAIDRVLAAEGAWSEPALLRGFGELLGEGDRVLLASSMPVRDAEAFLRGGAAEVAFFANRGANGIDGLVSTATGLASGSEGSVWAVLGDLALAHDLGGLATLAQARCPVRILVVDNGGGRIFDFLPQAAQVDRDRFERLFITPSDLDLERAASMFGLEYARIGAVDELGAARGIERGIVHAPIDPGPNVELHRKLAAAVAAALAG